MDRRELSYASKLILVCLVLSFQAVLAGGSSSLSATEGKTSDAHNAAESASARREPGEVGNGLPGNVADTQLWDSPHQNSRDEIGDKQPAVLEQSFPRHESQQASVAAAVIEISAEGPQEAWKSHRVLRPTGNPLKQQPNPRSVPLGYQSNTDCEDGAGLDTPSSALHHGHHYNPQHEERAVLSCRRAPDSRKTNGFLGGLATQETVDRCTDLTLSAAASTGDDGTSSSITNYSWSCVSPSCPQSVSDLLTLSEGNRRVTVTKEALYKSFPVASSGKEALTLTVQLVITTTARRRATAQRSFRVNYKIGSRPIVSPSEGISADIIAARNEAVFLSIKVNACSLAVLGTDLKVTWELVSISAGDKKKAKNDKTFLKEFENRTFAVIQPDRLNVSGAIYEVKTAVSYQPNEDPDDVSEYLFKIRTEQVSLKITFCLEEMNITQSKKGGGSRHGLPSPSSSTRHFDLPVPKQSSPSKKPNP
ncbi:hypothetical protein CSUI_002124 [Cystoisospora suis]|uniref:Uncharacterized protein n=1 Tax=Cystoisospora suis TaxID=483139 RepID=A0A2C6LA39_9APIC|nr:hypothetical protein CSUI_002124 [Cystoisospora suis]